MRIKLPILLILTLLLPSCSRSGIIERKIGERIENCQDIPCVIKIEELTKFEWDKMYVFSYGVSLDEIERTLGTSFSDYVEFKRRMVFLKDGRIIHREDETTDIEGMADGEVVFDGMEKEPSHISFTRDGAVFVAEKYYKSRETTYVLRQVK